MLQRIDRLSDMLQLSHPPQQGFPAGLVDDIDATEFRDGHPADHIN